MNHTNFDEDIKFIFDELNTFVDSNLAQKQKDRDTFSLCLEIETALGKMLVDERRNLMGEHACQIVVSTRENMQFGVR